MEAKTKIFHCVDTCRFETVVDGVTAYVEYEIVENSMIVLHTLVPEKISGRGIAAHLVEYVLEYAQANGLRVDPRCSYVRVFIQRHPQYADNVIG